MDCTGTVMGMATIAMAGLTLAAPVAGLSLLAAGDHMDVALGLGLALVGAAASPYLANRVAAPSLRAREDRPRAYMEAGLAAAWPLIVIGCWQLACLTVLIDPDAENGQARWLFAYGVANAPWLWRAYQAGDAERTLRGIQSYGTQLAFMLMSCCWLLAGLSLQASILVALLPLTLPFTVALLMAFADPDVLRDVYN